MLNPTTFSAFSEEFYGRARAGTVVDYVLISTIREKLQCFKTFIAAERQRGSTLFLTTNVVFPEPTRPSPLPRFMYSRDLDLCPSVCYDVVFPGGRN